MQEERGVFFDQIHNNDYASEYLLNKVDNTTLLNISGRSYESLNGEWNFAPDWYDTCRRSHWYKEIKENEQGLPLPLDWDWESWERIKVPSCWNVLKKELTYFEGSGIYTRTFNYSKITEDERCFLHFEGANYQTSVFLNGVHLGTHNGGSTPFSLEATNYIKSNNRIIVVVDARRIADRVPMDNTDWFNYGGLYRDVILIRTPQVFIKDWFIRMEPDGTYKHIVCDVYLSNCVDAVVQLQIDELNINENIEIKNGNGHICLTIENIQLWSPENPYLYSVILNLIDSHEKNVIDYVKDRIGFKEIRVLGSDIYLNGKKIFLKGICVHEDHIEYGKTTNEEIIRSTIKHLKELYGNYLRLAHYPHDRRFAIIADEEGIILWEEIPVYWAIAFNNKRTFIDAENQISELIKRDRNRVSVAIWSIGNENADTNERLHFMSELAKRARFLDETRLVSAACLIDYEKLIINDRLKSYLDIIGINEYLGWYDPDFSKLGKILSNSTPDKPVIICEFGAGALSQHRGTITDLFSEDMQKHIYEAQLHEIISCSYIKGISPWILYDFRCPRRLNRFQKLFNRKGIIDADRKTKKEAFFVLSDCYKRIK